MAASNETIHDRIARARLELGPLDLAVIVAVLAATAFVLLFLQEPLAHESLHNFRHVAGVTCH